MGVIPSLSAKYLIALSYVPMHRANSCVLRCFFSIKTVSISSPINTITVTIAASALYYIKPCSRFKKIFSEREQN